jgi:hypothetical protein
VYEKDLDKLPTFINTAVPEIAQDGSPTRDQARWQGIYIHTPAFTIITLAGRKARWGRRLGSPASWTPWPVLTVQRGGSRQAG